MITAEQPVIIEKIYSYDIENIVQQKINGLWKADVQYSVHDQNGERLPSIVLSYSGEDYNNWFNSYNSGEFLIQELLSKKEIQATIPSNIEEQFINLENQ